MFRAYSGKSHGGFRGPAFRFRSVRLSLFAWVCALGEKSPGLVSGLPGKLQGNIRVHAEGKGFLLSGKAIGEPPVFPALQVQPAAVGFLANLLPFPGATVQRFYLGICQRHGNFLLVSRLFIPGRREQIPTKVPTKNGVVHVLPRFTPVHDRRTKKKKESPRRRLQTAGNFYGFLGQGRAVSVSAMASPCSAISDSAIGKKRNVSLKMAPFQ